MIAAWVALLVAALVPVGRARMPASALGGHGAAVLSVVTGLIGVGLGYASLVGAWPGASPALGAAAMLSCVIAAALPSVEGRGVEAWGPQVGLAVGPAAGAAALGALGVGGGGASLLASPGPLSLAFGAAVMMALATGFTARGVARLGAADQGEGAPPVSAALMLSSLLALLAFRALSVLGGSGSVAHLPVMDKGGAPVMLLLDFDLGIPATTAMPSLGGLILAGAAVALIGSLLPDGKLRTLGGASAAGLLVGVVVWLMVLHGQPVEVDLEQARAALARAGADAMLVESPRFQGEEPMAIGAGLAMGPWMLLVSAAAIAAGEAAASWVARGGATEAQVSAARLGARDALQVSAVAAWLGVAMVLVYGARVFGVWGPSRPVEHGAVAVAFGVTALVFALHGAGARPGVAMRVVRALALAGAGALLAGAMAGGLVGAAGLAGL